MPETTTTPTVPAAPTSAPPPAPAPVTPAAPEKPKLADPFADVRPAPEPATTPPPKPGDAPPAKADDKPFEDAPKPGDPKKTVSKRADPLAEQRARIEQQNGIISETTRERDELRQKIAQLEARGGGDTAAMTKALEDLKQKNQQLSGEIAAYDYSKSESFQNEFVSPFKAAAEDARNIINSLEVTETDVEGNQTNRPAVWEKDFKLIFSMERPAALAMAKKMFPEDFRDVMSQFDTLTSLDKKRENALQNWQKGADEREQKTRAESLVRTQNIQRAFDVVTQNYMENDEQFQIKPDDTENSELWKKSQAVVDKAYFERDKLAPHELIMLDAAVRLRAINEPVLRAKMAKLQAELDDYKSRLDEKEASTSGKTRHVAAPSESQKDEPWDADLRKALQNASP